MEVIRLSSMSQPNKMKEIKDKKNDQLSSNEELSWKKRNESGNKKKEEQQLPT